MQVVGHEQERLLRGKVGDQPEQALQRAVEALLGSRLAVVGGEDGGGGLGASGEGVRRLRHLALEQLADHSERERAVELGAAAAEHAKPGRLAERADGAQQLRLAHAGLSFEDDESARAARRARDQRAHVIDFRLALEQRVSRSCRAGEQGQGLLGGTDKLSDNSP